MFGGDFEIPMTVTQKHNEKCVSYVAKPAFMKRQV
jgi:hypothetical protein